MTGKQIVEIVASEDPDAYREQHGRCPPGYHFDGESCAPIDYEGDDDQPPEDEDESPEPESEPESKDSEPKPGGEKPKPHEMSKDTKELFDLSGQRPRGLQR